MYYVCRLLEYKRDCFGTFRWTCFKVVKLHTPKQVDSGCKYSGPYGLDISCGFSTEEAADMHIRYPLCYPNDKSATEIITAPFDRSGWMCFFNQVTGINDPANATLSDCLPSLPSTS